MAYLDRFQKLKSRLEHNSHVRVIAINDIVPDQEPMGQLSVEDYRLFLKYEELPDGLQEYVHVSCGLRLSYSMAFSNDLDGGGEFALRSLDEALFNPNHPQFWENNLPAHEIAFLKGFRIIDEMNGTGHKKLAALVLREGISPPAFPDIYFWDRGKGYKMAIDYVGYLDALLVVCAITDWQYLFCEVDFNDHVHSPFRDDLRRSLRCLQLVFPERDFGIFLQRLDGNLQDFLPKFEQIRKVTF